MVLSDGRYRVDVETSSALTRGFSAMAWAKFGSAPNATVVEAVDARAFFVRGSTVQFYQWLNQRGKQAVPEGPAVWICGDCHVGNVGPVADSKGRVAVPIYASFCGVNFTSPPRSP